MVCLFLLLLLLQLLWTVWVCRLHHSTKMQ
jgi:hypothetical protein